MKKRNEPTRWNINIINQQEHNYGNLSSLINDSLKDDAVDIFRIPGVFPVNHDSLSTEHWTWLGRQCSRQNLRVDDLLLAHDISSIKLDVQSRRNYWCTILFFTWLMTLDHQAWSDEDWWRRCVPCGITTSSLHPGELYGEGWLDRHLDSLEGRCAPFGFTASLRKIPFFGEVD